MIIVYRTHANVSYSTLYDIPNGSEEFYTHKNLQYEYRRNCISVGQSAHFLYGVRHSHILNERNTMFLYEITDYDHIV